MSAGPDDNLRRVEIVVSLWIRDDADVVEVVQEMDYHFTHAAIVDSCIEDILTEI